MKHSKKVKAARKMMSNKEKRIREEKLIPDENGISRLRRFWKPREGLFTSLAWEERKRAIAARVERQVAKAKARKAAQQ